MKITPDRLEALKKVLSWAEAWIYLNHHLDAWPEEFSIIATMISKIEQAEKAQKTLNGGR